MSTVPRVYYWDLFGARAEATVENSVEHLNEFQDRHGFADCVTGTESSGPGHRAAWCRVAAAAPGKVHDAIHVAPQPRRHQDEAAEGNGREE